MGYRRLYSELRIGTQKNFIIETCNEITKFQQTGLYDLMDQKMKEFELKDNKQIQRFGIGDSKGNFVTN